MINKLIGALPVIKNGVIKGAALAAYLIDTMKDIRKYDPARDPWRNYRADEINPEIAPLLEKARIKRGEIFIPEKGIDLIIDHQNKDLEECERYIKWKYLGELSYKEAFLDPVEAQKNGQQDEELRKEVAQLRAEIQALTKAVQDLRSTILIAD